MSDKEKAREMLNHIAAARMLARELGLRFDPYIHVTARGVPEALQPFVSSPVPSELLTTLHVDGRPSQFYAVMLAETVQLLVSVRNGDEVPDADVERAIVEEARESVRKIAVNTRVSSEVLHAE